MDFKIEIGFNKAHTENIPHYDSPMAAQTSHWTKTNRAAEVFFKVESTNIVWGWDEAQDQKKTLVKEICQAAKGITAFSSSSPGYRGTQFVNAKECAKMLDGVLQIKKERKASVNVDETALAAALKDLQEGGFLNSQQTKEYLEAFRN